MDINVVLVQPAEPFGAMAEMPASIIGLASILRNANISVEILDARLDNLSVPQALARIKGKKVDVLGITGLNNAYRFIKDFCFELKRKRPDIPIMAGGPFIFSQPELILSKVPIDVACTGEGDEIIVELVQRLANREDLHGICNIAFWDEGKVFNSEKHLVGDLDPFPFPAYDLLQMDRYLDAANVAYYGDFYFPIPSGRGCTHHCYFCGRLYDKVRRPSPTRLLEIMDYLNHTYRVASFLFYDDGGLYPRAWILEFCSLLVEKSRAYRFGIAGCPEQVDDDVVESLVHAGCSFISFGVEHLTPEIQKGFFRTVQSKNIETAFETIKKHGLYNLGFNLLWGHPNDTNISFQHSYNKALEYTNRYDLPNFWMAGLVMYPNSRIQKDALDSGKITDYEDYMYSSNGYGPYVNLTSEDDDVYRAFIVETRLNNDAQLLREAITQLTSNNGSAQRIHDSQERLAHIEKRLEILQLLLATPKPQREAHRSLLEEILMVPMYNPEINYYQEFACFRELLELPRGSRIVVLGGDCFDEIPMMRLFNSIREGALVLAGFTDVATDGSNKENLPLVAIDEISLLSPNYIVLPRTIVVLYQSTLENISNNNCGLKFIVLEERSLQPRPWGGNGLVSGYYNPDYWRVKINSTGFDREFCFPDSTTINNKVNDVPDNKLILFFTPEAGVLPHYATQCVLARTLKESGHRVLITRCTGLFTRCPVMDMHHLPYNADSSARFQICAGCVAAADSMLKAYDLEPFELNHIVTSELVDRVRAELDAWNGDLADFVFEGVHFGEFCAHDVVLALKIYRFDNIDEEARLAWKAYILNSLIAYSATNNLCRHESLGAVIHFNDYSLQLGVRMAAIKNNARVFSVSLASHRSVDFRNFVISPDIWRQALYSTIAKWSLWRDLSINSGKIWEIAEDTIVRMTSVFAHIYSSAKTFSPVDLLNQLGLDRSRNTVVAYTSSYDELVAGQKLVNSLGYPQPDISLTFPDQMDWLKSIVEKVENSDNLQLVVRIHPREGINKNNVLVSQHLPLLKSEFSGTLRHCTFIWPEDSVSSYDLAELAHLVLIGWSTIGLELARLGAPVLAINRGTTYPGDDFIEFAETPEEYFKKFDQLLIRPAKLEYVVYAYRYYNCFTFCNAVDMSDIITSSAVTSGFQGLPPFRMPQETEVIERVLIDNEDIVALNLERLRNSQDQKACRNEQEQIIAALQGLFHYLMTGQELSRNVSLLFYSNSVNNPTTVRGIVKLNGDYVEYQTRGGEAFARYSPMCARIARIVERNVASKINSHPEGTNNQRKLPYPDNLELAVQAARDYAGKEDYQAAIDWYEASMILSSQFRAPLLAELNENVFARLADKDRYTLYVSRYFNFDIRPGDKVLDIGSGNLPFPLATHLADLALANDRVGRAGVPFKHLDGKPVYECDLENLPFADQEFDFVYCSHVLEHVENPEKACAELMRVARRGYIETPNRGKDLWLNTAKISNHKWAVEKWNETLIFTEYTPHELEGLESDVLLQMHCAPQNEREKAFSALLYLKADLINVMHYWENSIACEVRRSEKSAVGDTMVVSTPGSAESGRNASCIFVNTYYDAFLNQVYSRAGLDDKPYKEQLQRLVECLFGDSDFYSKNLKQAGWNTDDLIVNCVQLQKAWARENGCDCESLALVIEQVKLARPDCIYLQNLGLGTKEFLDAIRPHTELIVGQIASPLPEQADLSGFDVVFSSFPHFVDRFRAAGITAYYQPLAFEPRVLKSLTKFAYSKRPVECSFVGGISPMHGKGYQLLENLAAHVPIHFWGYGAETVPADSAIRACHHGEVWGTEMFYLLGASKITINRHIDVAENNANNMRLFEATGCGALLITDYKDNLSELFEIGKEIVVYRSAEECIELVRYYLSHSDEAEKIAKAGQARTLRDHTYEKRMKQTAKILLRHLRYSRERRALVMPTRISDSYRPLEPGGVTTELQTAWKSPDIPLQQRALVQQQLIEMYRGNMPEPFKVLNDLLSPLALEGILILEIGCASGYYCEVLEYLLKRQIAYTGVDYSSAMIDMARDYYPETSFLVADGAKLPIADKTFRIVVSGCILLHTPNYTQHIAETARVAEQWIAVHRTPVCRTRSTTCFSKMAYGVETVEFRFNEQELLGLFEQKGFKLAKICTYLERPQDDEYEVSYLLERVQQYAVKKPSLPSSPYRPLPGHNRPVVLVSRAIAFTFPLSYAYLAGQLRTQGEDVRVLFKDIPAQALVKQIMDINPLIVGFGNLYPELEETRVLIRMLDQAGRKFPIVIGGQMVSPTPEFAVRITGADFGVIGEGELILAELVQRLRTGQDVSNLKGLVVRHGNDIKNNGSGDFIENLSTGLPSIPYDLFPTEQWLPIGEWYAKHLPVPHWKIDDRVINVHGGRGCPFTCNFCYHHSNARYRDTSVMMDEAQEALIRFNGNMLYFSDDLVMANPKRVRELIEAISRLDRPVSFQISTRFDILARMDDELLLDLKRIGCRSMGLGLESGSDRILKLIGKNCTVQQIEDGLDRLRLVGIYPTTSIMLGQHTETVEDALASIALMQRTIQKDPYLNYAFTLTTPFPGSTLYDLIFKKGLLKNDQEFYDRYFSTAGEFKQVVNLSAMSDNEVMAAFYEIQRVYDVEKRKANALLGIC